MKLTATLLLCSSATAQNSASCTTDKCKQLEQAYTSLQKKYCGTVVSHLPSIPSKDSDAFMAAYKAFNGTNEDPVFGAASQILTHDKVDTFLSLPDSFTSGGLDESLVRCAVLFDSPTKLAEYASQGTTQETLVNQLLGDTLLAKDMLVAGGAEGGMYGQAMEIYDKLLKKSEYLADIKKERDDAATVWDDRSQKTILYRLALGTALQLAVPVNERFGHVPVDPVSRYLHYEKAYKAGDLDPGFEVLTSFECRHVSNCDSSDSDLVIEFAQHVLLTMNLDSIVNTKPVLQKFQLYNLCFCQTCESIHT
jgi:hypothetical protein